MFFKQQAEIVQNFPGSTLASVSELFSQLGLGVAEAQAALDDNSIRQTLILAGVLNPDGSVPGPGQTPAVPQVAGKTLLELGFVPSFYHFEYVDISVSMFVSMEYERNESFDFDIDYRSGQTSEADASASNTGNVTITVVQGEARRAKAKVVVKKSQQGAYLAIDGDRVEVVQTGTGPLHVPIQPRGLYQLSDRIAAKLRSGDVPKIGRVEMKVTSRGIDKVETNNAAAFEINEDDAWVKIRGGAPTPARAWFGLTDNGDLPGDLGLHVQGETAEDFTVAVSGGDMTPGSDVADTANLLAALVKGSPSNLWDSDATRAIFTAGQFENTFLFNKDSQDVGDPPAADSTKAERAERLDTLAAFLDATGVSVDVVGHTDSSASAAYNLGLGTRRANAVIKALVDRGVSASQLNADSKGETQLLGGPDVEDRRVEIRLKGSLDGASIVQVETATPVSTWEDNTTAITGLGGSLLGKRNGEATAAAVAEGNTVSVKSSNQVSLSDYTALAPGSALTPARPFEIASGVVETAENLAQAINEADEGGVSAYAQGPFVYLLGPGSEIELTMYAATAGKQGNDIGLAADGQAIVVPGGAGFSGGADAGTPNPKSGANPTGDTVSLGPNTFELVSSSPTGQQFVLGSDAPGTAKNLADRINAIAGFSASVPTGDADTINVTGPSGTSVSTSNATAFVLSSPKIGGFLANASAEQGRWRAFAVSAGYHFQQRFDVTASGNASVSGRLRSIPPPAQFIQSLEDWTSLFD